MDNPTDGTGDPARLEERKDVLRRCLDRLDPGHRRLIEWRYFEHRAMGEIGRLADRSLNALYAAFSRIHAALHACMERQADTP